MSASKASRINLPTPALPVLGLLLAWGILITQVRHHWGGESYYNFGWFVPFLSIWLLMRNLAPLEPQVVHRIRLHVIVGGAALLLIVPFHALSEVNPFWRLPLWIQAMGLITFTGAVIHFLYGWKGVRASIFPVFFLCTMIPWPYRLELMIVQNLTGIVVELAVNGLHFLGYPVRIAGNSLVLGELSIGVNEACSGIRSLQALFMVTLFLGSLFGQSTWRRTAAVLVLPVIVILVNTARAIFLAVQVIVNGEAAYDKWHDPAGYIAFGISMVLIYACIELLNVGSDEDRQSQTIDLPRLRETWSGTLTRKSYTAFVGVPLLLFAVVEAWFQYHEATAPEKRTWVLSMPEDEQGKVKYLDVHPQVRDALGYGYGHRFLVQLSPNSGGEFYYYGYGPDDKLASVSSYGHSPAICMEAVGATMLNQYPDLKVKAGGMTIPIHHYLFELRGTEKKLHVFWVIWEHRNMDIDPEELQELNYKTQWIQLLKGRRDFSRQVLLASLVGMKTPEQARKTLNGLLENWIQPASGS